jgi:S-adenosylmethionine:tRNA ribosyltransferase-isomerase
MDIRELDYDLPPELIAQEPAQRRDEARLLLLHRGGAVHGHALFRDLPELLAPGDLLVLNDTRVLPARLLGHRAATGGRWEGLFLSERSDGVWELLCRTRGHLHPGDVILVGQPTDELHLTYLERSSADGTSLFRPEPSGTPETLLARFGQVPLPPYIRRGRAVAADRERYQTVYARPSGSVAAPTAGLHFTPELFESLARRGIERAFVTLHVGVGTFRPIQVEDVSRHQVHEEWCEVPAATVAAIAACKERGGQVIAVGTTSTRSLETAALDGTLRPWRGPTTLTIRPPFAFRVIDGLLTNFHLPRSSLLLLVAAFTGLESMRAAYRVAVERSYRFYSYGDAMLIL